MMVAVRYGSIGCMTDMQVEMDREMTAACAAQRLRQALADDREWFSGPFSVRFPDGELLSLHTHPLGWKIDGDSELMTLAFLSKMGG